METLEYKGHTIIYRTEDNAMDPRESDNLGTMICSHRIYNYLDEQLINHGVSFRDDLIEYLKTKNLKLSDVIELPIYGYQHSGMIMQTFPYHCPFDSGQLGWIYVSKEKIRKEFNVSKITKSRLNEVYKYLRQEISTYSTWLNDGFYEFAIGDDKDDLDWEGGQESEEEVIKYAKQVVDGYIKQDEERIAQLEIDTGIARSNLILNES